jgi:uncharacterized membrane protein
MLGRLVAVAALAAGGMMLKKKMGQSQSSDGTSSAFVEDSIEVEVPVSTAYNQWTQFEEFPNFMNDVEEVRQVDDTHLHWRARIAGKDEEWDAEITHQVPDKRIAWRSTSGPPNSGAVTFQSLGADRTRITLRMSYRPPGLLEKVGDALGVVKMEIAGNLKRFSDFIESRQRETGAWRGAVSGGSTLGGNGAATGSDGANAATSTTGV